MSAVVRAAEYLFLENIALRLVMEHREVANWQKLVDQLLADKEMLAGVRLKFRDVYDALERTCLRHWGNCWERCRGRRHSRWGDSGMERNSRFLTAFRNDRLLWRSLLFAEDGCLLNLNHGILRGRFDFFYALDYSSGEVE